MHKGLERFHNAVGINIFDTGVGDFCFGLSYGGVESIKLTIDITGVNGIEVD